jgi:hypothetical protein
MHFISPSHYAFAIKNDVGKAQALNWLLIRGGFNLEFKNSS